MSQVEIATVIKQEEITPGFMLMELASPEIAAKAVPGQFVHVKCTTDLSVDPLLRRPISLHWIDPKEGKLILLYHVVGRGTEIMARFAAGDKVDLMGPLGRGFTLDVDAGKVFVIGGGIGAAPLLPLVEALVRAGKEVIYLAGARNKETLFGLKEAGRAGAVTVGATDDGSYGYRGMVTEALEALLKTGTPGFYYTCGPEPMIRSVVSVMEEAGVAGEVSLEERMGCGVGACLACVCQTKIKETAGTGAEPGWTYRKVCTEGPVFPAGEVVFGE